MRQPIHHALVRDQDVNFAVVSVKDSVLDDPGQAERLIETLQAAYGHPVILMGEEQHKLFGRQDIVDFLSGMGPGQLPWQESEIEIPE